MELSAAEHARVGGEPSAPSMPVGALSVRAVALLGGVLVECRFVRRECSGSLRGFTPRGTAKSAGPTESHRSRWTRIRMPRVKNKVLPVPATGERYGAKGRKMVLPKSLEAR